MLTLAESAQLTMRRSRLGPKGVLCWVCT